MALHLLKGPFTVDAYQRLAELGVLREDDRVELLGGRDSGSGPSSSAATERRGEGKPQHQPPPPPGWA